MQLYQGTKKVLAKPMKLGEYNKYRGWELPQDEDGNSDGYLIEYVNGGKPNHPEHKGYISWSPSKVFDDAYKPIADAQDAIEQGKVINLGEFLLAVDAKLHGSTGFDYVFYDNSKAGRPYLGTVSFQRGNPNEVVNGLTNEVLLAVLMDRIEVLDERVPHDSNKVALGHIKSAYDALCARVRDRKERGVMFTDKV
jgi:hypothetical protein